MYGDSIRESHANLKQKRRNRNANIVNFRPNDRPKIFSRIFRSCFSKSKSSTSLKSQKPSLNSDVTHEGIAPILRDITTSFFETYQTTDATKDNHTIQNCLTGNLLSTNFLGFSKPFEYNAYPITVNYCKDKGNDEIEERSFSSDDLVETAIQTDVEVPSKPLVNDKITQYVDLTNEKIYSNKETNTAVNVIASKSTTVLYVKQSNMFESTDDTSGFKIAEEVFGKKSKKRKNYLNNSCDLMEKKNCCTSTSDTCLYAEMQSKFHEWIKFMQTSKKDDKKVYNPFDSNSKDYPTSSVILQDVEIKIPKKQPPVCKSKLNTSKSKITNKNLKERKEALSKVAEFLASGNKDFTEEIKESFNTLAGCNKEIKKQRYPTFIGFDREFQSENGGCPKKKGPKIIIAKKKEKAVSKKDEQNQNQTETKTNLTDLKAVDAEFDQITTEMQEYLDLILDNIGQTKISTERGPINETSKSSTSAESNDFELQPMDVKAVGSMFVKRSPITIVPMLHQVELNDPSDYKFRSNSKKIFSNSPVIDDNWIDKVFSCSSGLNQKVKKEVMAEKNPNLTDESNMAGSSFYQSLNLVNTSTMAGNSLMNSNDKSTNTKSDCSTSQEKNEIPIKGHAFEIATQTFQIEPNSLDKAPSDRKVIDQLEDRKRKRVSTYLGRAKSVVAGILKKSKHGSSCTNTETSLVKEKSKEGLKVTFSNIVMENDGQNSKTKIVNLPRESTSELDAYVFKETTVLSVYSSLYNNKKLNRLGCKAKVEENFCDSNLLGGGDNFQKFTLPASGYTDFLYQPRDTVSIATYPVITEKVWNNTIASSTVSIKKKRRRTRRVSSTKLKKRRRPRKLRFASRRVQEESSSESSCRSTRSIETKTSILRRKLEQLRRNPTLAKLPSDLFKPQKVFKRNERNPKKWEVNNDFIKEKFVQLKDGKAKQQMSKESKDQRDSLTVLRRKIENKLVDIIETIDSSRPSSKEITDISDEEIKGISELGQFSNKPSEMEKRNAKRLANMVFVAMQNDVPQTSGLSKPITEVNVPSNPNNTQKSPEENTDEDTKIEPIETIKEGVAKKELDAVEDPQVDQSHPANLVCKRTEDDLSCVCAQEEQKKQEEKKMKKREKLLKMESKNISLEAILDLPSEIRLKLLELKKKPVDKQEGDSPQQKPRKPGEPVEKPVFKFKTAEDGPSGLPRGVPEHLVYKGSDYVPEEEFSPKGRSEQQKEYADILEFDEPIRTPEEEEEEIKPTMKKKRKRVLLCCKKKEEAPIRPEEICVCEQQIEEEQPQETHRTTSIRISKLKQLKGKFSRKKIPCVTCQEAWAEVGQMTEVEPIKPKKRRAPLPPEPPPQPPSPITSNVSIPPSSTPPPPLEPEDDFKTTPTQKSPASGSKIFGTHEVVAEKPEPPKKMTRCQRRKWEKEQEKKKAQAELDKKLSQLLKRSLEPEDEFGNLPPEIIHEIVDEMNALRDDKSRFGETDETPKALLKKNAAKVSEEKSEPSSGGQMTKSLRWWFIGVPFENVRKKLWTPVEATAEQPQPVVEKEEEKETGEIQTEGEKSDLEQQRKKRSPLDYLKKHRKKHYDQVSVQVSDETMTKRSRSTDPPPQEQETSTEDPRFWHRHRRLTVPHEDGWDSAMHIKPPLYQKVKNRLKKCLRNFKRQRLITQRMTRPGRAYTNEEIKECDSESSTISVTREDDLANIEDEEVPETESDSSVKRLLRVFSSRIPEVQDHASHPLNLAEGEKKYPRNQKVFEPVLMKGAYVGKVKVLVKPFSRMTKASPKIEEISRSPDDVTVTKSVLLGMTAQREQVGVANVQRTYGFSPSTRKCLHLMFRTSPTYPFPDPIEYPSNPDSLILIHAPDSSLPTSTTISIEERVQPSSLTSSDDYIFRPPKKPRREFSDDEEIDVLTTKNVYLRDGLRKHYSDKSLLNLQTTFTWKKLRKPAVPEVVPCLESLIETEEDEEIELEDSTITAPPTEEVLLEEEEKPEEEDEVADRLKYLRGVLRGDLDVPKPGDIDNYDIVYKESLDIDKVRSFEIPDEKDVSPSEISLSYDDDELVQLKETLIRVIDPSPEFRVTAKPEDSRNPFEYASAGVGKPVLVVGKDLSDFLKTLGVYEPPSTLYLTPEEIPPDFVSQSIASPDGSFESFVWQTPSPKEVESDEGKAILEEGLPREPEVARSLLKPEPELSETEGFPSRVSIPEVPLGPLPPASLESVPELPAPIPEDSLARLPEDSLARLPEDSLARLPEHSLARLPEDSLEPLPKISLEPVPEVPVAPLPQVPLAPLPVVPLAPLPVVPLAPLPVVPLAPLPKVPSAPLPKVPPAPLPEEPTKPPEERHFFIPFKPLMPTSLESGKAKMIIKKSDPDDDGDPDAIHVTLKGESFVIAIPEKYLAKPKLVTCDVCCSELGLPHEPDKPSKVDTKDEGSDGLNIQEPSKSTLNIQPDEDTTPSEREGKDQSKDDVEFVRVGVDSTDDVDEDDEADSSAKISESQDIRNKYKFFRPTDQPVETPTMDDEGFKTLPVVDPSPQHAKMRKPTIITVKRKRSPPTDTCVDKCSEDCPNFHVWLRYQKEHHFPPMKSNFWESCADHCTNKIKWKEWKEKTLQQENQEVPPEVDDDHEDILRSVDSGHDVEEDKQSVGRKLKLNKSSMLTMFEGYAGQDVDGREFLGPPTTESSSKETPELDKALFESIPDEDLVSSSEPPQTETSSSQDRIMYPSGKARDLEKGDTPESVSSSPRPKTLSETEEPTPESMEQTEPSKVIIKITPKDQKPKLARRGIRMIRSPVGADMLVPRITSRNEKRRDGSLVSSVKQPGVIKPDQKVKILLKPKYKHSKERVKETSSSKKESDFDYDSVGKLKQLEKLKNMLEERALKKSKVDQCICSPTTGDDEGKRRRPRDYPGNEIPSESVGKKPFFDKNQSRSFQEAILKPKKPPADTRKSKSRKNPKLKEDFAKRIMDLMHHDRVKEKTSPTSFEYYWEKPKKDVEPKANEKKSRPMFGFKKSAKEGKTKYASEPQTDFPGKPSKPPSSSHQPPTNKNKDAKKKTGHDQDSLYSSYFDPLGKPNQNEDNKKMPFRSHRIYTVNYCLLQEQNPFVPVDKVGHVSEPTVIEPNPPFDTNSESSIDELDLREIDMPSPLDELGLFEKSFHDNEIKDRAASEQMSNSVFSTKPIECYNVEMVGSEDYHDALNDLYMIKSDTVVTNADGVEQVAESKKKKEGKPLPKIVRDCNDILQKVIVFHQPMVDPLIATNVLCHTNWRCKSRPKKAKAKTVKEKKVKEKKSKEKKSKSSESVKSSKSGKSGKSSKSSKSTKSSKSSKKSHSSPDLDTSSTKTVDSSGPSLLNCDGTCQTEGLCYCKMIGGRNKSRHSRTIQIAGKNLRDFSHRYQAPIKPYTCCVHSRDEGRNYCKKVTFDKETGLVIDKDPNFEPPPNQHLCLDSSLTSFEKVNSMVRNFETRVKKPWNEDPPAVVIHCKKEAVEGLPNPELCGCAAAISSPTPVPFFKRLFSRKSKTKLSKALKPCECAPPIEVIITDPKKKSISSCCAKKSPPPRRKSREELEDTPTPPMSRSSTRCGCNIRKSKKSGEPTPKICIRPPLHRGKRVQVPSPAPSRQLTLIEEREEAPKSAMSPRGSRTSKLSVRIMGSQEDASSKRMLRKAFERKERLKPKPDLDEGQQSSIPSIERKLSKHFKRSIKDSGCACDIPKNAIDASSSIQHISTYSGRPAEPLAAQLMPKRSRLLRNLTVRRKDSYKRSSGEVKATKSGAPKSRVISRYPPCHQTDKQLEKRRRKGRAPPPPNDDCFCNSTIRRYSSEFYKRKPPKPKKQCASSRKRSQGSSRISSEEFVDKHDYDVRHLQVPTAMIDIFKKQRIPQPKKDEIFETLISMLFKQRKKRKCENTRRRMVKRYLTQVSSTELEEIVIELVKTLPKGFEEIFLKRRGEERRISKALSTMILAKKKSSRLMKYNVSKPYLKKFRNKNFVCSKYIQKHQISISCSSKEGPDDLEFSCLANPSSSDLSDLSDEDDEELFNFRPGKTFNLNHKTDYTIDVDKVEVFCKNIPSEQSWCSLSFSDFELKRYDDLKEKKTKRLKNKNDTEKRMKEGVKEIEEMVKFLSELPAKDLCKYFSKQCMK